MMDKDPLENALESFQDEEKGSMDVLLQLTLPIVLILAIMVSNWAVVLNDAIEAIKDLGFTSTVNLRNDVEKAILELQHQLLLKATDTVIQRERQIINIAAYRYSVPKAEQILTGRVSQNFISITRDLYNRFGEQSKYEKYFIRLKGLVRKEYKLLANEYFKKDSPLPRNRLDPLKGINEENESYFITKLTGHTNRIKNEGVEVQYQLALTWIKSKKVSSKIESVSNKAWENYQAEDEILLAKADSDEFNNLLIIALEKSLADSNLKLISKTLDELKK